MTQRKCLLWAARASACEFCFHHKIWRKRYTCKLVVAMRFLFAVSGDIMNFDSPLLLNIAITFRIDSLQSGCISTRRFTNRIVPRKWYSRLFFSSNYPSTYEMRRLIEIVCYLDCWGRLCVIERSLPRPHHFHTRLEAVYLPVSTFPC